VESGSLVGELLRGVGEDVREIERPIHGNGRRRSGNDTTAPIGEAQEAFPVEGVEFAKSPSQDSG
jgi:hypothetical protein